jgi:glycosidase
VRFVAHRLRLPGLSAARVDSPLRFFHVRKDARDAIGFADALFAVRGDVVFTDLAAAERFADALRKSRGDAPSAVELQAMGLVHEVQHAIVALYRAAFAPNAFDALFGELRASLGGELDRTLLSFLRTYPPPAVYRGEQTAEQFLASSTDGIANEQWALEELLLLWLTNQNPAYEKIHELVHDDDLVRTTAYAPIIAAAAKHFEDEPRIGAAGETLVGLLLAPIRHAPSSLAGQLEYMRTKWGLDLTRIDVLRKLLAGEGALKEAEAWLWRAAHAHGDPPPAAPPTFAGEFYEHEPERFSRDLDWMPRVVMIAKSTFVWLDQLARRYKRPVTTLADVPDEELDEIAHRGFTGLWLIGVWRRSRASQRIKQMQGKHDALASAYSLDDYEIAEELGGHGAYENLRDRARARGIRLASDMVPNHMGIDSTWVINHPERFLQTDHPPFPTYRFTGNNLSDDDRVEIRIEDGYWSKTDAAVVFQRLDRATGSVRYVYHGNDGTSMPWNDTAQLDYLRADVREAVIQTILRVARMFPILRFDAAMTLAKRHFQRLWFPLPGGPGDCVPSRSANAMSREDLDRFFPIEFWREVVDRVAAEAPDTLLLAEAFWMMEGFFVRTLGMHRVYNSAFMNMLKREDNASYRASIRNVLEYEPRILERHVNFMNNPDEETAVAQFGKDDKYFGVCVLMATMPGLPMFGHGQIEGYTEKYGMEFQRAAWNEEPDSWLVERHEREIFPLLRRRHLFSGVDQFFLYDFVRDDGSVDEDVIAYSNRCVSTGGSANGTEERSLVVYHNKFKSTAGRLELSVGYRAPSGNIERRRLADALGIHDSPNGAGDRLIAFRDRTEGLEYVRRANDIAHGGLRLDLGAFKYRVFVDWRELEHTTERPYGTLADQLGGRGVASLDEAVLAVRFAAIHASLDEALTPGSVRYLLTAPSGAASAAREKMGHLLDGVAYVYPDLARTDVDDLEIDLQLLALRARPIAPAMQAVAIAWLFVDALRVVCAAADGDDVVDAWRLEPVMARAFRASGMSDDAARTAALAVRVLVRVGPPDGADCLRRALDDAEGKRLFGANEHGGVQWFRKEGADLFVAAIEACGVADDADVADLRAAIAASGYRVSSLVARLGKRSPFVALSAPLV